MSQLRVADINSSFEYNLSRGLISGASTFIKVASNIDLDTGGFETVWKYTGLWSPLTTARTIYFSSTSANDTLAGTGARTLLISGVDASRNLQTEIINMNGLSTVTTVNTWLGVNEVQVIATGSLGYNGGTITFTATTDNTVQSIISIEDSASNQLIYHIPTGYVLHLGKIIFIGYKSSGALPNITIEGFLVLGGVRYRIYESNINTSVLPFIELKIDGYSSAPGGAYLYFNASTDTNNSLIRGAINGVLEQI